MMCAKKLPAVLLVHLLESAPRNIALVQEKMHREVALVMSSVCRWKVGGFMELGAIEARDSGG